MGEDSSSSQSGAFADEVFLELQERYFIRRGLAGMADENRHWLGEVDLLKSGLAGQEPLKSLLVLIEDCRPLIANVIETPLPREITEEGKR